MAEITAADVKAWLYTNKGLNTQLCLDLFGDGAAFDDTIFGELHEQADNHFQEISGKLTDKGKVHDDNAMRYLVIGAAYNRKMNMIGQESFGYLYWMKGEFYAKKAGLRKRSKPATTKNVSKQSYTKPSQIAAMGPSLGEPTEPGVLGADSV